MARKKKRCLRVLLLVVRRQEEQAAFLRTLSEVGKQSRKTLLYIFERYIEGYMTLFDAMWSV